ncbi:MAG: zinc ABC transporter substrate-binding protein [Patescibacteria group bacterium]
MIKFKKKIKVIVAVIIFLLVVIAVFYYFQSGSKEESGPKIFRDEDGKIIVSAASFPVYDFAKEVGGDKVKAILLLPPGIEAHSFNPTAKELSYMASSSIVFYDSILAEPWMDEVMETLSDKTRLVAIADNLAEGDDPHVWLDFSKDLVMVDNIKKAYQSLDAGNYSYYETQAANYKNKLQTLDQLYFSSLKNCQFKDLVQGGHQAFAYLTRRYSLNYFPSQGPEPKMELDMTKTLAQVDRLKESGQGYIYYEELIMPSLAEVVRQQTGAKMLMLNATHNVARFDIEGGLTFIKIMENNLKALKLGLLCQ